VLVLIRPSGRHWSRFLAAKVEPGQKGVWQRSGYMVETPHAYPDLTVRENLEISRRLRQLKDAGSVENIIGRMGLAQYRHRRALVLSLGNASAWVLAKGAHPSSRFAPARWNRRMPLDPAGDWSRSENCSLVWRKMTRDIFISSHILSEVAKLATRIGVVHQGRLVKRNLPAQN